MPAVIAVKTRAEFSGIACPLLIKRPLFSGIIERRIKPLFRANNISLWKKTRETAHVERWNNTLRQHLARFMRKTLSFSKCTEMHEVCLKLFLHYYNTELLLTSRRNSI